MKNTIFFLLLLCSAFFLLFSCNKNSNNYSQTDKTVGMTNNRFWSGTFEGYYAADTTMDTVVKHDWPKHFIRVKTDTSFAVKRIDGYDVNMLGTTLPYRSMDVANKIMRFDTVVPGTLNAALLYYYGKDSMSYEYHSVGAYNAEANQYIQENIELHTKPAL